MGSKSKQPAARLGDIASNHGPWPPTPIIAGAGSVTINGIPAARKGDAVLLHAIPNNPPHARSIAEGAGSVIIEGKPAARVSDAISCGGKVATGSGDVSIGDSPSLLKATAVNIPDLNIPDIVFAKQTGRIAKSKAVTPTQTTALQADDAVIYTPPPAAPAAPADTLEATDTLSANKQSAVDYWSQQKDSADNFPEYLAAHLMGLNAETGYSIAEGLQATYEIVTDKEKFLATMDAVKDSFVDTVTDPVGTFNSIKQAAVEFSQLPLSEQGEAAYKGMLGLLAGGGGLGKTAGTLGKAASRSKAEVQSHSTLRQTGGGNFTGSADELYDAIRASDTDVGTIAANTGIKPQNVQKVKDHVFNNEHLLDKYVDYGIPAERARFDSDLNQAQAWQRLENGTHTDADITWLKHETAERWYELRHNSGYSDAHNAAERKWTGNPWGEN